MEDLENYRIDEKFIPNSDLKEVDLLLYNVCKSVCKVVLQEYAGSGFLLKFLRKNKPFKCLITWEHIIKQSIIGLKREIYIYYNNQDNFFKINLNESERIIRSFKYLNIDSTVIEIKDKDNIDDKYFLHPNLDYINGYQQFENMEIFIPQYPGGKKLSYSEGKIKIITHETFYEFSHLSSTMHGSSGSPIFLKGTDLVLGIHKQRNKFKTENYGQFIGPIIDSLGNDFSFKKEEQNGLFYEYEIRGNQYYGKIEMPGKFCYVGEINEKLEKNGKGILYNKDNILDYEGDFISNEANGKGKVYYTNGNLLYEGDFRHDYIFKGKYYSKKGFLVYDGEFKNFLFDGEGTLYEEEGYYFIGNFKEGKLNGGGLLFDKNNNLVYSGNFKDGKYDGFGTLNEGGNTYIGQFKDNLKQGKGKTFDKNGKLLYEGDYNNDNFEGNGIYYHDDETFIKGQFTNGQLDGKGVIYDKNENIIYEGDFNKAVIEGKGRFNFKNGSYYIGKIKGSNPNGYGTLYDKKGNIIYDGEYKDGKMEGKGLYIEKNGNCYFGEFRDDQKHGQGTLSDKNGNVIFEGYFKFDEYDKGKYFLNEGEYEGEFFNGNFHGQGVLKNKKKLAYIYRRSQSR